MPQIPKRPIRSIPQLDGPDLDLQTSLQPIRPDSAQSIDPKEPITASHRKILERKRPIPVTARTPQSGNEFELMLETSTVFATKATRLSEKLESIERFLQSLPGKLEVQVGEDHDGLRFAKYQGEWRILYLEDETACVISKLNIETKSKAAAFVPLLVEAMISQQRNMLAVVSKGLDSLESIDVPDLVGIDVPDLVGEDQ